MANGLVAKAPGLQAGVDVVLIRVDEAVRRYSGPDDRLDRRLPDVGQHLQHHLPAALDQPQDRRLLLVQRAPAGRALQAPPSSKAGFLATAAGLPLCPATT
jgi:hypothetical protein